MKKTYLYIVFFLLCNFFSYAQEERVPAQSQPFNEETWRKASLEMGDYRDEKERPKDQSQQKRMNIEDKFKKIKEEQPKPIAPPNVNAEAWAGFFKILAIVLGLAIIGGLIYNFMGGMGKSNTKLAMEELESSLAEMEENLPMVDVETPLEKAIRLGEYRVATRMYFLLIIQKLANQSIIKWRKDKTNRAYVNEIRQQSYLPQFMSAVLVYEKAWFGLGEVTKDDFEKSKELFENLKSKI